MPVYFKHTKREARALYDGYLKRTQPFADRGFTRLTWKEWWADHSVDYLIGPPIRKESIQGKVISREEAFRGLGDPRTWESFTTKVMMKFRAKPPQPKGFYVPPSTNIRSKKA